MRTFRSSSSVGVNPPSSILGAALLFVATLSAPAFADSGKVDGSYEVKFEEMSTNCDPPRFAYTRGTLKIDSAKSSLRVNIETVPAGATIAQMAGGPAKAGKINAKTLKKTATSVQGLDGSYRVSGRVDETGLLQLVLVGEFSKSGETKMLCTQSWNVSGVRQAAAADKPSDTKKVKKSATDFMPSLFE